MNNDLTIKIIKHKTMNLYLYDYCGELEISKNLYHAFNHYQLREPNCLYKKFEYGLAHNEGLRYKMEKEIEFDGYKGVVSKDMKIPLSEFEIIELVPKEN